MGRCRSGMGGVYAGCGGGGPGLGQGAGRQWFALGGGGWAGVGVCRSGFEGVYAGCVGGGPGLGQGGVISGGGLGVSLSLLVVDGGCCV